MNVVGLIVEYNPLHNGHMYHLEQSKNLSGSDYSVCVMSGNFIQRGEPAVINKWARTKMALHAGVDLVIELPAVFSMASAEFFAYGAVKILDSLGIVSHLSFGSESGNLGDLEYIADILVNEPDAYRDLLKENLNEGLSFPSSREAALKQYLSKAPGKTKLVERTVSSSNNILGIEYLKALKKIKSSIKPQTIYRIANTYNTREITGNISSATAIRLNMLDENGKIRENTVDEVMPVTSKSILEEELLHGRGPVFPNNLETMLLYTLRHKSRDQLREYPYVSEGLENRIKNAAENCGSFEELIDIVCTKRYTRTRIQRILFSILIGIKGKDLQSFIEYGGPQYIRVLGFNKKGRELLSKAKKKHAYLPIMVKTADFRNTCNPLLRRMLELEAQATDTYVLGYRNSWFRRAGQDFTQNIIRV